MVGSDGSLVDPEPAFFKESMKREDTTGIMIWLALWDTNQSLKSMFGILGRGDLCPANEGWKHILNIHLMSAPPDLWYATYLGRKSEYFIHKLTGKHKHKVSHHVSQNGVRNARNS